MKVKIRLFILYSSVNHPLCILSFLLISTTCIISILCFWLYSGSRNSRLEVQNGRDGRGVRRDAQSTCFIDTPYYFAALKVMIHVCMKFYDGSTGNVGENAREDRDFQQQLRRPRLAYSAAHGRAQGVRSLRNKKPLWECGFTTELKRICVVSCILLNCTKIEV